MDKRRTPLAYSPALRRVRKVVQRYQAGGSSPRFCVWIRVDSFWARRNSNLLQCLKFIIMTFSHAPKSLICVLETSIPAGFYMPPKTLRTLNNFQLSQVFPYHVMNITWWLNTGRTTASSRQGLTYLFLCLWKGFLTSTCTFLAFVVPLSLRGIIKREKCNHFLIHFKSKRKLYTVFLCHYNKRMTILNDILENKMTQL